MNYADRLLALAVLLGYQAPRLVSDHAARRFLQRFDLPMAIAGARAVLEQMLHEFHLVHVFGPVNGQHHREGHAAIWQRGEIKIIVSKDGEVLTTLPPNASRNRRD